MQAAANQTVLNAVPLMLHRLLQGVSAIRMVEWHPHRSTIGNPGGVVPPPAHTYDLTFQLSGIATTEALQHLAPPEQPDLLVWIARHAGGAEPRASGWRINRYVPNQIILTITTPVPEALDRLTVQIADLESLSWDI